MNLWWKISRWYLKAALKLSILRWMRYFVEKWDDKSAAWIKVKTFSFYIQTPIANVSEICVTNFRDRLTGKFCVGVAWRIFKFSSRDSCHLGDSYDARLLYLSLYHISIVYPRSRFSLDNHWCQRSFWPFYFIFRPLRREIAPITRKKKNAVSTRRRTNSREIPPITKSTHAFVNK